ncbi:uncharacterized protein EI90DRAFT_1299095 [Cantharellus anzutake]|uniref:uncharacterized protein n=1 Tax=Cantharellus anzutake TaxID=1750568 RepID=UPI0019072BD8|nr:uncharacterized protein EI90DRAFT_1299095 [Cantharellus anzutake]KAF8342041.1 hypothetical protein EI90DRAFT_1299095 [Cantharellus anzutake]
MVCHAENQYLDTRPSRESKRVSPQSRSREPNRDLPSLITNRAKLTHCSFSNGLRGDLRPSGCTLGLGGCVPHAGGFGKVRRSPEGESMTISLSFSSVNFVPRHYEILENPISESVIIRLHKRRSRQLHSSNHSNSSLYNHASFANFRIALDLLRPYTSRNILRIAFLNLPSTLLPDFLAFPMIAAA